MARDRYICTHAPTMLAIQAARAEPGARLNLDQAITLAGALYDRLTAAGHTPDSASAKAPRAGQTRKTVDHLAAMPEAQARAFEAFYRAYGHLKGKQRAAARWTEINPDAALAARITQAAAADAATPRPADAIRKWPEGWLSERRWEDVPAPGSTPADPAAARAAEVRELLGDHAALVRLQQAAPTPATADRLAVIGARLGALGIHVDAAATASHARAAASGPRALGEVLQRLGRRVATAEAGA